MIIRIRNRTATSVVSWLQGLVLALPVTVLPLWAGPNQWINLGPGGGNVQALAIAPPTSTLYVGTRNREIFKSNDKGGQWKASSAGLQEDFGYYPPPPIRSLVVNPIDPALVFAGTKGGVFRSLDGGASWNDMTRQFYPPELLEVSSVVIDPLVPSNIYAGLNNGDAPCSVLKSTDGGDNWMCAGDIPSQQPSIYTLNALALDPVHPSTIYAGTFEGLFISYDGGSHWIHSSNGFGQVYSLAIDPTNPNILYAGNQYDLIYKSVDGGASVVSHK